MNIALTGYGRMGHEIEEAALKRGHSIGLIIDVDNRHELIAENLKGIDVMIEFTTPGSAFGNISATLSLGVPVVSGTTGWLNDYEKAAELCRKKDTSFIHSSNFSIGVNLLLKLSSELSKYMNDLKDYSVSVEEIHHTKKLDAPSGTAITIADGISENHEAYSGWCLEPDVIPGKIPVRAVREGMVPGTHTITWESDIDTLVLKHEARNRKGLAFGAVLAAEFIAKRKGVFTMSDVLGF
ncbi:MAG TPA: 4-hydroxy-tetrahydrodipicolinate reductase [Bacteroidales bacterium]|nr:4-hydroxy-tetrahydrodipicolinate reductase [Bacteroidales bacterium]HPR13548.1 4-hydroxy-tetrahydrodipicolinate reductase [Bacteroidales bacterium]HRW86594.1 4-hydroxy-tetrahydrodipicolinate reductase [Bacteroidales bacterium]